MDLTIIYKLLNQNTTKSIFFSITEGFVPPEIGHCYGNSIPAHLGVVSYTINAAVKLACSLSWLLDLVPCSCREL